jgi:hypothetical protein
MKRVHCRSECAPSVVPWPVELADGAPGAGEGVVHCRQAIHELLVGALRLILRIGEAVHQQQDPLLGEVGHRALLEVDRLGKLVAVRRRAHG